MTERLIADVAIIGGGIMGSSAALALRGQQRSVVLLEQGWCGAQASGVNYGGVRRQGRAPIQMPLADRAHALWQRLPEIIGSDGEYIMSGHLRLARSADDMAILEAYRELTQPLGLSLELMGREAVHSRYPWLGKEVVGASLCATDGHANPRLVAAGFALAAKRQGAQIHEGSRVDSMTFDGKHFTLRTHNGLEVQSRFLLNCAGAWGANVAAQFGEPVPEQPIYPSMFVTEPLPKLVDVNLGLVGGGFYARQVERGNFVIGGARGRAQGSDQLALEATRPTSAATFQTMGMIYDIIPALRHALVIRSWTGIEGEMPDDQPVLGPSCTTPGLLHAFGFSGAGFQLGPAVGEVLAELVQGGISTTPIGPFGIQRFSLAG
ncbi:FAD-binding oxidoreductase [Glaciimonas sp. PCH181]|uniref:NAD(P)/FAD-dependent oxidoreductase n=1 Tax=Glaciimonas sp. PCH181 TaxID=2133943 RepID=UPI000D3341E7|nr:FAD-dependent oxidoreductase [Glaciimonas sp. PCH181]PUA17120.1 FAD-dependent oxidoreductase [Glaciimonas sp. PCH181]